MYITNRFLIELLIVTKMVVHIKIKLNNFQHLAGDLFCMHDDNNFRTTDKLLLLLKEYACFSVVEISDLSLWALDIFIKFIFISSWRTVIS